MAQAMMIIMMVNNFTDAHFGNQSLWSKAARRVINRPRAVIVAGELNNVTEGAPLAKLPGLASTVSSSGSALCARPRLGPIVHFFQLQGSSLCTAATCASFCQ